MCKRLHRVIWLLVLFLACSPLALADDQLSPVDDEGSQAAPQQRGRNDRNQGRVYRGQVKPKWFAENSKFWYRNDLPGGDKEFIVVDAVKGVREPAFDHQAVARAFGNDVKAIQLPIESLEYDAAGKLTAFVSGNKRFSWNAEAGTVTESAVSATNSERQDEPARGTRTGADSSVNFINRLSGPVEIFWLNDDAKQSYGKIAPGTTRNQHTFGGHRWQIVNDKNESLGEIVADDTPTDVVIDGRKFESATQGRRRQRNSNQGEQTNRRSVNRSPDGKWIASIENHNVVIKPVDSDDVLLSSNDGRESDSYSQLQWSPDSKTLIAYRVEAVTIPQVHLLRSSPERGGRAQLESRPYALPGDAFPRYELNLFRIDSKQQIKPEVDRLEHEWLRPRVRFDDSQKITYEQTDRGHQRFRLIEVELESGKVRNIIDEKSDTFIWTAHTLPIPMITWLNSSEIIYATEKYGWRQLLLIDAKTGAEVRELTPKGIVVRGITSTDPEQRRIWISACGRSDQDPYFLHYASVDVDSGKLTWLTEGNGTHTIEFSPDRSYIIDNYSRVDAGPITELRRVSDGQLVCSLEQADLSELKSSGWTAPEVFTAKGRDGQTDIWGIICRPRDFDPQKKYPVIEDIYAGPQDSFVPKSFSAGQRYRELNSLGFIVVKIDGMGTANRSKAFHDVCWKNLKDGGFLDRIVWMKTAGQKYLELDLSRVGIYGGSAGGQNAAAAVLFHPEFYTVAVAGCGCHDNRMDKASWNEQWMGYPVGPHYGECSNVDNAHRLQGKLLLIVGEMDNNVPPESTLRVADALIKANKDFDMLVVPNAGHGMGGVYGQRRMHDFFVRHLLGTEPPNHNATASNTISPQALESEKSVVTQAAFETDARNTSTNPLLTVTTPPAEFFDLVAERYRPAARDFYKKHLDINGLPVVAANVVDDKALLRTHDIVTHMLSGRPDTLSSMRKNGMYLIIIGRDQVYTDMPEYSDHPNPAFQNERVRGTGGKPTSFGEENLLSLALDRYDDESIGVHEFCHTIDGALRSIDPTWSERLRETFNSVRRQKLYELAYAGSNAGEYWAEICQAYFDCNRVNNWNHGPVGTREQLKAYDPLGYELVRSTFRLSADQDWRYSFLRTLPAVEAPPAKLKIDPYYTKFSWAREFVIVGRDTSDQSILRANDIVRKIFAYRHDILKSFITNGTKLVVLGKQERLSDLPELKGIDASKMDLLSRYLEYSPETNLLVVSEESLFADPSTAHVGDSQLVRILASAIHQIAGTRPIDPNWDTRPRQVWQQYELRLKRLDVGFDQRLKELFDAATTAGKWQGTTAASGHQAYWITGVLAYFDAAGQTAAPTDSPRAIETREQLATYDLELYELVRETMAYDHHVDWRLRSR